MTEIQIISVIPNQQTMWNKTDLHLEKKRKEMKEWKKKTINYLTEMYHSHKLFFGMFLHYFKTIEVLLNSCQTK